MEIRKVAIIGLGLIGGSIAKALKQMNPSFTIIGCDRPEVIEKAKADSTIDIGIDNVRASADADLIFLCVPVDTTISMLKTLAPLVMDYTIITDVSGIKGKIQQLWDSLNSKGLYIGGHPMTGKERGGYDFSDPLLFENSVYIINDTINNHPEGKVLLHIITMLGARIVLLNPELHDKVVANVSHLPQLLSVALMNNADKEEHSIKFLDFAAGGFRDMTRIASSDFSIWAPVLKYNSKEIVTALDSLISALSSMKSNVAEGKLNALSSAFETARHQRDEIPKNTKGFITPLHDIFVFVNDEPGIISKISSILYQQGINIKDIELLKIREGTGGTFRLSFDSDEDAVTAERFIKSLGFRIK